MIQRTDNGYWKVVFKFNGNTIEKQYLSKSDAILEEYILELNYMRGSSPHIDKIKNEYPHLLNSLKYNVKINENALLTKKILNRLKKDSHCPCKLKKNKETICLCEEFRNTIEHGKKADCHCGLFFNDNGSHC